MKFLRALLATIVLGSLLTYPTLASEGPFENLGPQVQYVNVIKGKAGLTQYGQPIYYALLQGEPAKLAVVDLQSQKILDIETLEGAKAAWSIEVTPERKVYIGTTPNEHVYEYNTDSMEMKDLGKASDNTDTTIWDMAYDTKNNRLFGVTSYGGRVFSYSEGKGFSSLGRVVDGKQYARSVVYDETQNVLYAGVGSPASLIKWNLNTGEKTDILPSEYTSSASVYDLDLVNGKLFAKMEGSSTMLVFDTAKDQVEHVLNADSRGVSNVWNGNNVFYSSAGKLFQYNLDTKESTPLNSNLYGASAVSLDIVNVNGQPNLLGLSGNGGKFYKYNLLQNRFSYSNLKLPAQSVEIYRVGEGVDGSIYSTGFISGKLGVYNPKDNSTEMLEGLGQVEGFGKLNNSVYFGVYPNGKLYEYDTSDKWSSGSNPKEVLNLSSLGQDRPVSIIPDDEKQRLYIGSIPKRGQAQGMFTVFDPKTRTIQYQQPLAYEQSASSMAYDQNNDMLYMGTSVYDGSGKKSDESAKLYAIDTKDEGYKLKEIEIPGGYSIMLSALTVTEDGRVWGIIDNKLLVYDPKTDKSLVFPISSDQIKGMFKNESLLIGKDGMLYGTLQGMLFKVDPSTYHISKYSQSNVFHLAADNDGNLYYNSGANLWKVNTDRLTKEDELDTDKLTIPNVSDSDSPFPVARVYSKQPLILYKKSGDSMIPVKTLAPNKFYRVYGTYNNYYHVGNQHYFYSEKYKMSTYVGRIFTLSNSQILKPDGSVFRDIKPGEEIRVYSYDEQSYEVGNGYKVMKSGDISYYVGTLKLTKDAMLFKYGETLPELKLSAGEEYEILKTDGNKMEIGNGLYIEFNKDGMEYSKN
ncbi:hypothetical protein LRR81_09565 [Metabacillus sp. GX 13764]|uniref:hypothetical protein n=1 Tax=Metabacillus kandeliae TaxID=2900151 RepID=UPI001E441AA3|nr:hypothetical protein [Metabacillus kandeliae]MCD7034485.1 hypothetical protein [Metabacillus kandeliae]